MAEKQNPKSAPLSILVVDDNRFSSAMIKRALSGSHYQNIRYASSAQEALTAMQQQAVDILIADWLMPEMDGLQLTQQVRLLDKQNNHFTYIILITAKDGGSALIQAFDQGIDDFINKDHMNEQLLPRIRAADRVSTHYNGLINDNQQLRKQLALLESNSVLDHTTGLGNKRFALQKIKETIRYCEHRDGVVQLLLIEIFPWLEIRKQYPPAILEQIIKTVADELRALARPLDVICRLDVNQFILVIHQPKIEACYDRSFQRFRDKLITTRIKTPIGYLSVQTAMAIYAAEINPHAMISAELLISNAQQVLARAKDSGNIEIAEFSTSQQKQTFLGS